MPIIAPSIPAWPTATSVGDPSVMADGAAAPAPFDANGVHPTSEQLSHARNYRGRLLSRPSIVRVVNEARPYRPPSQRVRLRLMPAECHLWMLSKRAEALRVQ